MIDLPWLPAAPDDFQARCRALGFGSTGAAVQALATHRLDGRQAGQFGRAIVRLRAAGADLKPLAPFRLGLLGNSTLDLLAESLPAAAARHGVLVETIAAPFDQVVQQALDPRSAIRAAGCDAVLLMVDHRFLDLQRPDLVDPAAKVAAARDKLGAVIEGLKASGAVPILATLPQPPLPLFGSLDARLPGTPRRMIAETNAAIVDIAAATGSLIFDAAALAGRIGTDRWFDPVQWSAYKISPAAEAIPLVADSVGRLLGAVRGKARKCLVLDLDNTLWGGVIGDDGIEGIRIGQGDATGEAFLAIQQMALDLRERGIVLAVSSKNTDEVARKPFLEHPDMLLRLGHIAVFQANWVDKSANLEAIARTLNIGIDALVLLDDNPAERAQVRELLPMVAVPELPSDPGLFPRYLQAAGYFEAVAYSAEDRLRAESYASESQRAEVRASARSFGDYLKSLGMEMQATRFDERGRARIAQLINKTNQFNVTTRRYTEAAVAAMERDGDVLGLQFRLRDRFGDFGMIAVVICRATGDRRTWDIDTWLMSCRVLERHVEQAMLAHVVGELRARGAERLTARYIPTAKNGMVRDLFPSLGFGVTAESEGGERAFAFALADHAPPAGLPIAFTAAGPT